jgi:hypothetical protein
MTQVSLSYCSLYACFLNFENAHALKKLAPPRDSCCFSKQSAIVGAIIIASF